MQLMFTSKYVRFGLSFGQEEDDDDVEFVRNVGGTFESAEDDDMGMVSFGFSPVVNGG